jgi:hypothetical protein
MFPANALQFIKLMKEESAPDEDELSLRLMFCDFLSCCAFTILARTEDNIHDNVSSVHDAYILLLIFAASTLSSGSQTQPRISTRR